MGTFTKNTTLKGKYKNIIVTEDGFMDDETGEAVNVISELHSIYGNAPIEIVTTLKTEEET